ncbi:hypothetical protein PHYBLDRAFT_79850 [Phycomyces blakesleeanus NRRL 1555(-)]|uniref:OB domain-containing protein n=1 Tax=Phycomyces blakesleeanus (strain ATCC 8743b / DSM 1359 / FGSC 10004 / NBRC 33097 / NRRL 1555) TaxID=763407 RepID=A0A162TTX5_PHYB8|nr:hypothetical protein PHYBLDRAFT_79850 [Phycomyces blakesleeanus NRRL 1555(-)]OAD69793.1 hypothetical protein PHYBLDRAFT_79850 [Phycomyces blakesleeanus NRRL 1555(-)]|eukprot:XP_018287833.1 hypothetical protein PHYBLDRAFT_79850 [Phycomyces blakesleeanus NRRL 1555(-)]
MTSSMHVTSPRLVLIKDMTPQMKNFECEVIVIQKDPEPHFTRLGEGIYKALVADRTASISLNVFGTKGSLLKHGDILHIRGAQNRLYQGQLSLSVMKEGDIKRIGQDTFPFVEKPNLSEAEITPHRAPNQFRQDQASFPDQSQRAVNPQRLANRPQRGHGNFSKGRKPRSGNQRDLDQPTDNRIPNNNNNNNNIIVIVIVTINNNNNNNNIIKAPSRDPRLKRPADTQPLEIQQKTRRKNPHHIWFVLVMTIWIVLEVWGSLLDE